MSITNAAGEAVSDESIRECVDNRWSGLYRFRHCARVSTRASRVTIVDSLVSSVVSPQEFISKGMAVKICSMDDFLNSIGGRLDHDLVVHAASYVGPAGILKYTGRIAPRTLATTSALAEHVSSHVFRYSSFRLREMYGTNGVLREDSDVQFPAGLTPDWSTPLASTRAKRFCATFTVAASIRCQSDHSM